MLVWPQLRSGREEVLEFHASVVGQVRCSQVNQAMNPAVPASASNSGTPGSTIGSFRTRSAANVRAARMITALNHLARLEVRSFQYGRRRAQIPANGTNSSRTQKAVTNTRFQVGRDS